VSAYKCEDVIIVAFRGGPEEVLQRRGHNLAVRLLARLKSQHVLDDMGARTEVNRLLQELTELVTKALKPCRG